jgi:hypothetical protein
MLIEERCMYQNEMDTGPHVLFKEQWEKCRNCVYDPENNKRCNNYFGIKYSVPDIKPESVLLRVVKFNSPESPEDSDIKEFIA